jgi:hypothetical protein
MDEWDKAWSEVQDMFPDAYFSIAFDKETLESELSKEKTIFVVIKHKCYCHDGENIPNTYVQVNRLPGTECITYADAVRALIKYDYRPCEHDFLQNFQHIKDTIQYEAHFGI